MADNVKSVVVTAPTNIAVIKYWGKRCTKLNLPLNSSLSATLCQDHMKTTTKVVTSPTFTEDEIWLNEVQQDIKSNRRLITCFTEIRQLARKQAIFRGQAEASSIMFYSQKVHVHTENNFPTAAGLASSASGYAALVFALGKLFNITGDLSAIARQGSGSACRSLEGGFVMWDKGERDDGQDSIGRQIVPHSHWPELRIFVVVVNDARKKIGSTEGMQSTVQTSSLLQYRVRNIVENNLKTALQAVKDKHFPSLAEVIMKESNQLHAVCLDTYPPLSYLSAFSYVIIDLVHSFNKAVKSVRLAYTFDAGPNACLFTTEEHANEVAWLISKFLLPKEQSKGIKIEPESPSEDILEQLHCDVPDKNLVNFVINTCLGDGATVINSDMAA